MGSVYPFRFSEEVRKVGYWLFLYGSVGMAVRLYGVKPDVIPELRSSSISGEEISGYLGIVVFYLVLSIIFKGLMDVSSYFLLSIRSHIKVAVAASSPGELVPNGSINPDIQGIVNDLQSRENCMRRHILVASWVLWVVDLIIPLAYGILSLYHLSRPAASVLSNLVLRP